MTSSKNLWTLLHSSAYGPEQPGYPPAQATQRNELHTKEESEAITLYKISSIEISFHL